VTLQLQKVKEDKLQEGHQKTLEEIGLHLENVHVKYDGIISKARVIRDKTKRIEDIIVSEKKIDEMDVKNEGKPLNVKPYQHPHYKKDFKEDKKIDINITNLDEDGILINIHGTRHHKTIIQQDVIIDQHLL
jgi:hypothetical protein